MSDGLISPAEILKSLVEDALSAAGLTETAAVVGPANDDQQQHGVVQMVDAGMPQVDFYSPVITTRLQMRCLSGRLIEASTIARAMQIYLPCNRKKVTQADGYSFLVHFVNVDAGPSMHYDSPETNEVLLFASTMMGTEPVEEPA